MTIRYWRSPADDNPGFHAYNAAEVGCTLIGRVGAGRHYTVYAVGDECPGGGWKEVRRGDEVLEDLLFDEDELFDDD